MLLRAVIIDDEQKGINALRIQIDRFINDVRVVAESTNAYTGVDLIENYAPDIVFLDINMPELDGFELLKRLTWRKFNLIFTTAHQEYGLRALRNDAVDYLLKPIDYEDLQAAIDKVKRNILERQQDHLLPSYEELLNMLPSHNSNRIVVHSKNGMEAIETSTIVSLEARSNYTQINLTQGRHLLTSRTLRDFDELLCTEGRFMRVHHSFIINLQKVTRYLKVNESIVMSNDQEIPLSKSRRGIFFSWMKL